MSCPCSNSRLTSATSRVATYSSTTDCSVKLPGCCPLSIRLRRRSPSTASSSFSLGFGAPNTACNSLRVTGSRIIASHHNTACPQPPAQHPSPPTPPPPPPNTTPP